MSIHQPLRCHTLGLWLLFAVVLSWPFILHQVWGMDVGFGDVHLYRAWALDGVDHGRWPVLDYDWIYPIGALAPIAALAPLASSPLYESVFVTSIYLADAVIMMLLRDRLGARAAAWWLCFLLFLGPVAESRLDGIAVVLATAALLVIANRPRIATVLVTSAAWVKVAHGAWMLPILLGSRRRLRDVIAPAAAFTLGVALISFALGGERRLFSFVGGQSDRSLQIESVAATPFDILHMLGRPSGLFGNRELHAWEFIGPTARQIAQFLDIAMLLAVICVGILTFLAARRDRIPAYELLLLSITATTLAMITFNKVGSAQYILWLSSPLAASFALRSGADSVWRPARLLALVAAAATQLLYPVGYFSLLHGDVWAVGSLIVRNAALVTLLVLVSRALWRAGRPAPVEVRVRR